ncbi:MULTISPECIES: hypothetical protein [unclassified Streptomyces]|uniref:hypothetical protein n=1 Tax=unclassified Streptomyces TaxID=2593676 RepID=UPI00081EA5D5|nr:MULTISPECIES: hypothetical protein [unclassified Streptomyces]SCF75863.1 hypothetical protein GA0115259_102134 [Streptomyces sp. MnatMP-M17]
MTHGSAAYMTQHTPVVVERADQDDVLTEREINRIIDERMTSRAPASRSRT